LAVSLDEGLPLGFESSLLENVYFQQAANILMVFGMSEQGVSLMAQALVSDLVNGFTTWNQKIKFVGSKKACSIYMRNIYI
jgi:hypothetical protein